MTAKVPKNTWLGFGWGPDMDQTSMIEWSADGSNSYTTELWSPEEGYPDTITDSCYTTTISDRTDYVEFTSKRPLDCNDGKYVVELDTQKTWISAWT